MQRMFCVGADCFSTRIGFGLASGFWSYFVVLEQEG